MGIEEAYLLAIETSCDETAAAICDSQGRVVASEVASQIELHAPFGGVVPELASRNHNNTLRPLLEATLQNSGVGIQEITAVAATSGPGLSSSLLIGDTTAKAIALALNCSFYSINHIEGHLLSPFIGTAEGICPNVSLIVSGGHTQIVHLRGVGDYEIMGKTLDDAAGEAFDKVGKMLGLPYPGGPEIDRRAERGDATAFQFPRSMIDSGDSTFSFSGIKTSVYYCLEKMDHPLSDATIDDLCASFQRAVVEVLVRKLIHAATERNEKLITISGGVSCNRELRRTVQKEAAACGLQLAMASPAHSTDNAAMIAYAAHARREAGVAESPLNADIDPNLAL